MKPIEKRLTDLEAALQTDLTDTTVLVIYDLETGLPLAPIPEGAEVIAWIPDNQRGVNPDATQQPTSN